MSAQKLGEHYQKSREVGVNSNDPVFVTGNRMKLREVQYILSSNTDVELTSQDLDGLLELQ